MQPSEQSSTDEFSAHFGLLKHVHLESFVKTFGLQEVSEVDREAAERELEFSLALRFDMSNILGGREDIMWAQRQNNCRVKNKSEHACRELIYDGPHASCPHHC